MQCERCGTEYTPRRQDQRFCSSKCRNAKFRDRTGWVELAKLRPFVVRLIEADLRRKR
jgi:methionyl-tRNA synthetase